MMERIEIQEWANDPEQGNSCSPRSQEIDSDGDVLEMASPSLAVSDGPSYRTSLYAILTAAPFKEMISIPVNSKGILLQHFLANDKVVKLSGNYLKELSCKLEVFPVLIPYCKLKSLNLAADWYFDSEIPEDGISWPLSSSNAECLGKLPDLEILSFWGYSEVDLSAVSIPKLKELTIKSDLPTQMVDPSLAFQYGITFCPPRACLLETLEITGPDGVCLDEEVPDGFYSLNTSVNLTILECCQNIEISGASIILVVPSATEQHDLTDDLPPIAALENLIKRANGWKTLQMTISKSLMDNEEDDGMPEVHVESGWGLAEISLENLAYMIEKHVPGSVVQLLDSVESEGIFAGDQEMRLIKYKLLARTGSREAS